MMLNCFFKLRNLVNRIVKQNIENSLATIETNLHFVLLIIYLIFQPGLFHVNRLVHCIHSYAFIPSNRSRNTTI